VQLLASVTGGDSSCLGRVCRGDVTDLDHLRTAAAAADGVIHTAFNHDFANLKQHSEDDRQVIRTLGEALAGSDRPLVLSSGTGLARSQTGGPAVETDDHVTSAEFPRAASEEAGSPTWATWTTAWRRSEQH
jgi:hypothetical protein